MRLAVISDVHGNAHALEAVLADIAGQAVELTVNLGDHLSGPMEAGRTADMLVLRDFPSIAGNHDRWLIDPPEGMRLRLEDWSHPQLAGSHLDWIRSLPPTRVVENDIFMCHATPQDDMTGWLDEFVGTDRTAPVPLERVEPLAEGLDYSLLLCGHTHIPRMVRLCDGRLIVNPGSVGYPGFRMRGDNGLSWSAGAPHARYAILEKTRHGWSADFRAVAYDWDASAAIAEKTGAPEIAQALVTGWVGA